MALWNASGLPNLGDRLIDEVTRRELGRRLPGAGFTTFTPWPDQRGMRRLRIDAKGRWVGEGRFDAIVVGGGALITGPPFSDPSAQFFLLGPYPRRFRDRTPIAWNAMCADRLSAVVESSAWRGYLRDAVARVGLCTVRNSRTRRLLEVCGVERPIAVVPDVAVLCDASVRIPRTRRHLAIGVAVGAPVFPDRTIRRFATHAMANRDLIDPRYVRLDPSAAGSCDEAAYHEALAARLHPLARTHRLLVFGFGDMYGDPECAARIAQRMPGAELVKVDPLDREAIAARIGALDCLIGSRLHACVLALALGTPHVAVDIYAPGPAGTTKLREHMTSIGLAHRYLGIDEVLGTSRLETIVEEVLASGREGVEQARYVARVLARRHFDELASFLLTARSTSPSLDLEGIVAT